MSIAKRVVGRPTTFLIIYFLIVGLALYILPQIAIDLLPDISVPFLSVYTTYPGASPEEVEQTVTRPLEGAISNATGIRKITSTSSEGQSIITLELRWGLDLSESTNDVRDKLEFIKGSLPEGASTPQIFKFDLSIIPVYQISVEGNRDTDELYDIAKNQIQPRLEQAEGVSLVTIYGGRDRAIRVEILQNRLEAYGLTMLGVSQALSAQNIQIGSGSVYEGNFKYLVQTQGQFGTVEEIRNAVIAYRGGGIDPSTSRNTAIRLRDIADVSDSYKDAPNRVYVNGVQGIYLSIQKQSGTNSVEVANNIVAKLKEVEGALPAGVNLRPIYDTTKFIRNSLRGVTSSAILGALLAMLVLLFFLRSVKSTFIIGLSIPISLLTTIMIMYFAGLTLNLMTLAGLTLGIGMIVDSSIVILENIYRYREKGAKAIPASFLGAQEMMTAITASILTTVAIFLPLLMFKRELDLIGVLFQDLSLTIIISLLVSLLVAITLVPVLTSKYLVLYTHRQRPSGSWFFAAISNGIGNGFIRFNNAYKRLLNFVLEHKGSMTLIMILLFIVSFFTLEPLGGNIGIESTPEQAGDYLEVRMEFPVGTRYEVTEAALMELADRARREIKGYQDIFIFVGTGADFFVLSSESHRGMLGITLLPPEERIDTYGDALRKMRANFDLFPSANFDVQEPQFFDNVSPIDVILRSEDLDKSSALAAEIRDLLENQVDEVIEPQVSFRGGLPITSIVLERDKAYSLGLNISSVANEISAAVNGKVAGRYRSGGDEIDILVILREEDRLEITDLNRIYIPNQAGERIPVSSIARIERTTGPVSISRENRSRVVHVTARPKPQVPLNAADAAVKRAIAENIVIDEGVVLEYSGDFANLIRLLLRFLVIVLVALALVYGIMASLFESLKDPFIVFLSIFMIIPGILFMYSFMNLPIFGYTAPLSMYTAFGLLMLVGISVNNGIVLIDYMNLLRNRGYRIREATVEGSGNRLRPVLMTSLTTIIGMAPLAFNTGDSAELVRPIGQTIIGGMLMSTLMTLFLVPMLYERMNRKADLRYSSDIENFDPNSPDGAGGGGGSE